MVATLDPRYNLPSRTHFAQKVIPEIYKETRFVVEKALEQSPVVAVTTDGWTSRATVSYVTITAHTMNDDYQMQDFVLQTRALCESHTGDNIADVLTDAADEWKLLRPNQTIPITTDNATNMDAAVRIAEGFCPHIPCFAHTVNLACQRGLKVPAVARLLGRVRRIVSFFHRSTTAAAMLKRKQALLQLPIHKLTNDVSTRWNSSLEMLERYVEQQAAIMATLMEKEIRRNFTDVNTLSEEDTHHIELLIVVLQPLKTVTTLLCASDTPTISMVLPLKCQLLTGLAVQDSDITMVRSMKGAMREDLAKRYTDSTLEDFLWRSTALDPRFRSLPHVDAAKRRAIYAQLVQQVCHVLDILWWLLMAWYPFHARVSATIILTKRFDTSISQINFMISYRLQQSSQSLDLVKYKFLKSVLKRDIFCAKLSKVSKLTHISTCFQLSAQTGEEHVVVKTEPRNEPAATVPALPVLNVGGDGDSDSQDTIVTSDCDEPPQEKSALDALFGDFFVTRVEPGEQYNILID